MTENTLCNCHLKTPSSAEKTIPRPILSAFKRFDARLLFARSPSFWFRRGSARQKGATAIVSRCILGGAASGLSKGRNAGIDAISAARETDSPRRREDHSNALGGAITLSARAVPLILTGSQPADYLATAFLPAGSKFGIGDVVSALSSTQSSPFIMFIAIIRSRVRCTLTL
jgi:hypothetical protein